MASKKTEEQDAPKKKAAKPAAAPKAKKAAASKAEPGKGAEQPEKAKARKDKPAEKKKAAAKEPAQKAAAKEPAQKAAAKEPAQKAAPPRLKTKYKDQVAAALQKEFSYPNLMAIPRIAMIKINIGMGEATQNSRLIDAAVAELGAIAGQKPIVTRARKSIAAFKLREGMPIGCAVTLRGDRMYEFLDRLIGIALPRVRDFRGISAKAFDGRGNYTLGLKEHVIFPEIDYSKVDHAKGMNVTLVTTARTDRESLSLLRHMGMPFQNQV